MEHINYCDMQEAEFCLCHEGNYNEVVTFTIGGNINNIYTAKIDRSNAWQPDGQFNYFFTGLTSALSYEALKEENIRLNEERKRLLKALRNIYNELPLNPNGAMLNAIQRFADEAINTIKDNNTTVKG